MNWGITVFFCALTVGIISGTFAGRGERSSTAGDSPRERAATAPARPKWTNGDFAGLIRKRTAALKSQGYRLGIELDLADWTDGEIHAALDETLSDPFCMVGQGRWLPIRLLEEWLKRDFDAAFGWFRSLESFTTRKWMASSVLGQWPTERAREGFDFLMANREMYPSGASPALLNGSIAEEAEKGAAALARWILFLKDEKLLRGHHLRLPDGLDFKGLFQELGDIEVGYVKPGFGIFQEWLRHDRDGALDWYVTSSKSLNLQLLMMGARETPEANTWLGSRLETLPPRAREGLLESLKSSQGKAAVSLLRGIRDEGLGKEIRDIAVQQIFLENSVTAIEALETLRDPEERLKTLEELKPAEFTRKSPFGPAFDERNESHLRQKLAEWNADEARIESIIRNLKP